MRKKIKRKAADGRQESMEKIWRIVLPFKTTRFFPLIDRER